MSEKPSLEDIFLNQVKICRPNLIERLQWNPRSQELEDSNTGYSLTLSAFLAYYPTTDWRRWEPPIAEPQRCPRCGAGAEVVEVHVVWVCCEKLLEKCGLSGPSCSTKQQAIDEWNKLSYRGKLQR